MISSTLRLGFILVLFVFQQGISQTRINGTVTTQNNQPLPGANVIVSGTTIGTSTDFNGDFDLTTNTSLPLTLEISFIGPTAAQLNRKYAALSEQVKQLEFFTESGLLKALPEHQPLPKFVQWESTESGTVEERAKAYLDINCAHCHQPQGSAKNSGLDLRFSQMDLRKRGVFKPPIAAGKGSGDLQYSIVPGQAEKSILLYRMSSNDPGVMMPEVGRSMVHQEGVALIASYIENLKN